MKCCVCHVKRLKWENLINSLNKLFKSCSTQYKLKLFIIFACCFHSLAMEKSYFTSKLQTHKASIALSNHFSGELQINSFNPVAFYQIH